MSGYGVCGLRESYGDRECAPAVPQGVWEQAVGHSPLTSLLAKWFCAWMGEAGRTDADFKQVCMMPQWVHLSLFQKRGCPVQGH